MADATSIEWMVAVARSRGMRAAVWNPVRGCRPASEGCRICWAAAVANMRQHNPQIGERYQGLVTKTADGRPVFNGTTRLVERDLGLPLRTRRPTAYFVCSEADLFGEGVDGEWLDRIFSVIALCPQHLFICLTKRPARMRGYFAACEGRIAALAQVIAANSGSNMDTPRRHPPFRMSEWRGSTVMDMPVPIGFETWPFPNVWLGVSVENQAAADERIPELLATPAALRWVSAEPLLGAVDLTRVAYEEDTFEDCGGHPESDKGVMATGMWWNAVIGKFWSDNRHADGSRSGVELSATGPQIDWVVTGSESGRGARPAHPDWFRSLRDQCSTSGVPFFFKQWGEWLPINQGPGDWYDSLYRSNVTAKDGEDQGVLDEFYGRTCQVPTLCLRADGRHCALNEPGAFQASTGSMMAFRVGKKAAGHLLDGIEHLAVPGVR